MNNSEVVYVISFNFIFGKAWIRYHLYLLKVWISAFWQIIIHPCPFQVFSWNRTNLQVFFSLVQRLFCGSHRGIILNKTIWGFNFILIPFFHDLIMNFNKTLYLFKNDIPSSKDWVARVPRLLKLTVFLYWQCPNQFY